MHILAVHVYAYVGVSAERATMMGTVEEALRKGRGRRGTQPPGCWEWKGAGTVEWGEEMGGESNNNNNKKTLLENAAMKPMCAN